MPKEFNTTGLCVPEKHYMVEISDRLLRIREMIDAGKYFTINRARQYGKTTTLSELRKYLASDYDVISLDFQGISSAGFETEQIFVQEFARMLLRKNRTGFNMPEDIRNRLDSIVNKTENKTLMGALFDTLSLWCRQSERRIVLLIDEVDSATNNQVFLDFLAQLRDGYISRDSDGTPSFQSVILAGVTDVKHLKSKIREDEQHKVNSPWNIAADFAIDMSLSISGIAGMLSEYEKDHHTGMNVELISKRIHEYTSGYPFLVCKICQMLDTSEILKDRLSGEDSTWTQRGIDEAVGLLVKEPSISLFESLMRKLINYPDLKKQLCSILMDGERIEALPYDQAQEQLRMYGFVTEKDGSLVISNRVFEILLYNQFLGEDSRNSSVRQAADMDRNIFIKDGRLDMPLILERFIRTYTDIFGPLTDKFPEDTGRKLFLLYLKPIINGTGNYYIEAQTRDQRRTDIVVDYLGQQYVIELKIWRGERYNAEGEQQISDYLDYFDLDCGYMLSFNFNKKKEIGVKTIRYGEKVLVEGVL
ncbi:MAG: AAA family ATPase [Lachnospiraceae bacterium]|nr:AAA family ATPase [Lachnospiraceae bacterium]